MLVDALEHVSQYEGYIFETGRGLARVLFRLRPVLRGRAARAAAQASIFFGAREFIAAY